MITAESIQEALAALGQSSKGVAKYLEQRGIKGTQATASRCPVAVYLGKQFKDSDRFLVARHMAMVGSVLCDLPDAVSKFVGDFDDGKYPLLIKRGKKAST